MTCNTGNRSMFTRLDSIVMATVCCLICAAAATGSFAEERKARIGDKTLLAWVQPSNLDQRAGSVLTIQDLREFDGIVFGEVRPRTWMPGSHLFHRTNTKQDSWPRESAGPDQMVQLAIVYEGPKISLYRNGQRAAEYETDRPHVFGPGLRVVIGVRHTAPFGLPPSRFAGKVEEARIYDRALSREEIAAMAPGAASSIKPFAQWTFEDGATGDEMGYFPRYTLHNGAYVAEGKLHLDGKDDYFDTGSDYTSLVDRRTYAKTLPEQLEQLKTDKQILRFAESRRRLAADPYRPAYHYVNPEGMLNDPNGLCCWQGRYHLFYQAYPPEDPRQHWGHAVSKDLVHWVDLLLAIYPGIEKHCFSGSTLVERDRVIAMYHGTHAGNMVAVSSDPLLLNWEKIPGNPVIPMVPLDDQGQPYRVYDPCIWKEKEGYYSLSGTFWKGALFRDCVMVQQLFFSRDLKQWEYLGPFVEGEGFTEPGEDGAVPYFWPIGDKHILLFASHKRGSQYLVGDYDKANRRFKPSSHGRFNFGSIGPGGVHAPSAAPDGKGGCYVIHNINDAKPTKGWNHLMSLVRVLRLRDDNTLSIEPVPAVTSLRRDHRHIGRTPLPADQEIVLDGIAGSAMEITVELEPNDAGEVSLCVLRSPDRKEYTRVGLLQNNRATVAEGGSRHGRVGLVLDSRHSSVNKNVGARPPEIAPFELREGEPLRLRVFVDRSVVEVFANGRQCVAVRVYPEREDSLGVSLRARGGDAVLRSLDAWQMGSIYAGPMELE